MKTHAIVITIIFYIPHCLTDWVYDTHFFTKKILSLGQTSCIDYRLLAGRTILSSQIGYAADVCHEVFAMTVVDVEEETAEVIGLDVEAVVIETGGLVSVKPVMIKKILKFIASMNCLVLLLYTFAQRDTSIYIRHKESLF